MPHTRPQSMVYPYYANFTDAVRNIPLSGRSLLVKCCQAQTLPTTPTSTLYQLLQKEPDIHVRFLDRTKSTFRFYDYLQHIDFNPSDPLEAAIYLDILRSTELDALEVGKAKETGWLKEILLANGEFRPDTLNWNSIFSLDRRYAKIPLHPDLLPNETFANDIHQALIRFRQRMEGRVLYARASHKNMSYETRRLYEESTHTSLDSIPIFGQDDYLRYYNKHGILLEGATEMRQKWYASGAKPRTYFAMGGHAYQHSRFLQDVFSNLVDSFPSFNHKKRLRPSRLVTEPEIDSEEVHWFIYDLSSFTSNCCVQRSFVQELGHFLLGTSVVVVDEREGPIDTDLGELVLAYYDHCVVEPPLSLERYDPSTQGNVFFHEVASMLGIFGNLMTCTFAHGTVVGMSSPDVVDNTSFNCAGDDGLIPRRMSTSFFIHRGISLVGSYEPTKCFDGNEEAPIHLKRPFEERFPQPDLAVMIIPPSLTTCMFALDPEYKDIRYNHIDNSSWTWIDRVNIVAKDLLRFLRSAYKARYDDVDRLATVVSGFERMVTLKIGWTPRPGIHIEGRRPFWPLSPLAYEFLDISPLHVLFLYCAPPYLRMERRENMVDVSLQYSAEGDTFTNNKTPRLKMLEMLGYVVKEELWEPVTDVQRALHYASLLNDDFEIPDDSIVYQFTVIRPIPYHFMYSI